MFVVDGLAEKSTDGLNTLEGYLTPGWKGLQGANTLAYCAHL